MSRYHINEKGEPGVCKAKYGCPFGDMEADHYGSKEEARAAYELQRQAFPASASKKKRYAWPEQAVTRSFASKRTPGGRIVAQISGHSDSMNTPHVVQAWLEVPDRGTVAYVQLLVHDDKYHPEVGEHLMMCDIETRPDSRKQGFARELRESMAEEVGLDIYSSGGMTPEGWEAFGKHVKTLPNPYASEWDKPGQKYNSMGFVASWKHKVPRNAHREIEYTDEQRDAMWDLSDAGVFRKMDDKEILWVED